MVRLPLLEFQVKEDPMLQMETEVSDQKSGPKLKEGSKGISAQDLGR